MNVTIIHGNARHGSTWHSVQRILAGLEAGGPLALREFTLPRDMPHFCNGCFSCFYNGENTCPHATYTTPIAEALRTADLIILTSPVYAMDVSGQMKAMLDHLCYQWMSHRPDPALFNTIGLTVSTTAGAGLSHGTKTLRNSLVFWGLKRVYSFKIKASAMRWDDVSDKVRQQIDREADRLARKILRAAARADRLRPLLFHAFFFRLMKGMMAKNDWNLRDRAHWERQGWINAAEKD